jgi:GTPase
VSRPQARNPDELFEAARNGDRTAKARLLSLIERGGEEARDVGRLVAPLAGHAHTIGLTGAPGAGKSTLTSALITLLRQRGEEVAVLAVDPSSPFTGGAILGDRVRMQDHATDPGVFIRSMATRGHLGGLALATPEAIRLLDALGHRWIVVETVGVGQVEVEVAGKADTTVVVVNPGWGDSVQASKAGLMEVADVFAINKADRPGVPETRRDLEQMLELATDGAAPTPAGWKVPIVATVASSGEGVAELWDAVSAHREHMAASGVLEARRRFRLGEELREIVARRLEARARELCTGARWDELTAAVLGRDLDPWTAADEMLHPVLSFNSRAPARDPEDGSGSETPAGTSARR